MYQSTFISPDEWRPKIADLPERERPTYRLYHAGPGALSTAEILAALIQTPNALDDADKVLQVCDRSLSRLYNASQEQLTRVPGIGPKRAAQIHAALELGRRMGMERNDNTTSIRSPNDIAEILLPELSHLEQEHFVVLCMDTRNRLVHSETVYKGSVNAAYIRVSEVLRPAIIRQCLCIAVAHNHPSGDATPSPEDVQVTRQIKEACDLLDIGLLDHVIVGCNRFVSMRERGLGGF
jgi:DNA repair protein RadC